MPEIVDTEKEEIVMDTYKTVNDFEQMSQTELENESLDTKFEKMI